MKYLFISLACILLWSCGDNKPTQSPILKKHERVVLSFWKNHSREVLDFFLTYRDLNEKWIKKFAKSSTQLNTQPTLDTIVQTDELETLVEWFDPSYFMYYKIHVGKLNGLSTDRIFPIKYVDSNYEQYLPGLTYGILNFHQNGIHVQLYGFNDPNINTNPEIGYNSIKIEIQDTSAEATVFFRINPIVQRR
jgi:hypothetical protein